MLARKQTLYCTLLTLIWIPALWFDSIVGSGLLNGYVDKSEMITSVMIIGLWCIIFINVDVTLKRLLIVMVPLSWLGEVICCLWLEMYHYRQAGIPLYVPFGHAIIYTTGLLITSLPYIQENKTQIKRLLITAFLGLFILVIIGFDDTLSACLGILFFSILHYKKYPTLYLIMSVLVLYLEVLGTQLGTWRWHEQWWVFHTINPPLGAIFIYIAGDMLLKKLVWIYDKRLH